MTDIAEANRQTIGEAFDSDCSSSYFDLNTPGRG